MSLKILDTLINVKFQLQYTRIYSEKNPRFSQIFLQLNFQNILTLMTIVMSKIDIDKTLSSQLLRFHILPPISCVLTGKIRFQIGKKLCIIILNNSRKSINSLDLLLLTRSVVDSFGGEVVDEDILFFSKKIFFPVKLRCSAIDVR